MTDYQINEDNMTKEQLKHTRPIDLHVALRLAFDAGCNYGISSHKDFVQIHEPCERVVEALARRMAVAPVAGGQSGCRLEPPANNGGGIQAGRARGKRGGRHGACVFAEVEMA